jgi:hypothetical protein
LVGRVETVQDGGNVGMERGHADRPRINYANS